VNERNHINHLVGLYPDTMYPGIKATCDKFLVAFPSAGDFSCTTPPLSDKSKFPVYHPSDLPTMSAMSRKFARAGFDRPLDLPTGFHLYYPVDQLAEYQQPPRQSKSIICLLINLGTDCTLQGLAEALNLRMFLNCEVREPWGFIEGLYLKPAWSQGTGHLVTDT